MPVENDEATDSGSPRNYNENKFLDELLNMSDLEVMDEPSHLDIDGDLLSSEPEPMNDKWTDELSEGSERLQSPPTSYEAHYEPAPETIGDLCYVDFQSDLCHLAAEPANKGPDVVAEQLKPRPPTDDAR